MNSYAKALTALAAVLALAGLSGCENTAQREAKYLKRGQEQVAAGDYEKARLEFQNALQIDPKSVAAQYQLARVQEKLQNWRAAAGGYQAVIEADPKHVGAKTHLARIMLLAGQLDAAAKMVDEAAALAPNDAGVLSIQGAVASKRGDTALAMKDARAALAADPRHMDAIMLLASLYQKQGRRDDAVKTLKDGVKAYPKDTSLHLALADVYAGGDDSAGAIAELQQIVQLDPTELSHRARLADYYVKLKRNDDAEKTLRQAVTDNPEDSRAKLMLTNFLATYRGREAAERQLEGYIQKATEDYTLRFGLAALYLAGGEKDKAEGIYRGVIDRDGTGPKGLQARVLLAKALVKEGKADDALKLVNEVLKENATDNDALLLHGMIELARNDADGAVTDFRAVQKDQPNSVQVAALLAKAQVAGGHVDLARDQLQRALKLQPQNYQIRLDYARLLAGDKDSTAQAEEQVATVLKADPRNTDALQLRFDLQMAKHDWAGARATAQQVQEALPDMAQGTFMLGLAYQGDKQYPAAAEQFKKVLARNPAAAAPLSALVKAYLAQKHPDDALKAIDAALKQVPDSAPAWNLKGEVLLLQKQFPAALTAFKAASRRDAKWDIPYRNRAAAHLVTKDVKGAEAVYREGIEASGGAESLRFDLAALYESQGDHEAAIAEYGKAVDQAPTSVAAANNLAMMLVTYRKDSDSLARAKQLVQLLGTSQNPAYLDTYGWVLYKNGDLAPAVDAFQRAVQRVPGSGLLQYHLGMALYTQGDKAGARDHLQQALKDGSAFAGRDEAKAILDKLSG